MERALTGVHGLDEVLRGGLPRSRLYLVQGYPGVGKTTLAMQFILEGLRQGESCLYVTLSESEQELREVAASHGWELGKLHIYELSAAERLRSEGSENTLYVSSEIELHEATSSLMEVVERVNPVRVVFDSLSELRLLAQSALRYRRQILSLKEYFVARGCTALFLDDRTSDERDQQLQSLTHGVISVESVAPEYGADRRRVRVVKLRGVQFRGGYHDSTIERGGMRVFPRLVAAEHHTEPPTGTVASGVPALDALLGGGVDRGTSTLLIGPAGVGKSIVATSYAVAAAARGEPVAHFMFDENIATMVKRSAALGLDVAGHMAAGRIHVRQVDPAEMSPGEFAARVREQVDQHGARVVLIDSLNGYLAAMPEERFLTIQMHELLTYLAHKGVATFLVMAQYGLLGPTTSPIDMSYLADTVLLLRYFEARGEVRKAISVVKKRSGPHENTIRPLAVERSGVIVGEPLHDFQGVLTGVPAVLGGEGGGRRHEG